MKTTMRAYAYPLMWRIAVGALVAVSRASLPAIGVGLLVTTQSVPLFVLVRALVVGALVPGLAARLIGRAFAVDLEVRGPDVMLRARDLQIEIPCAAIAAVVPWALPLPGPGVSLRMQSGRRFRYGLQAAAPVALVSALADLGIESARATLRHPTFVYAEAQRSNVPWRWYHFVLKFVAFALVPTAVWFNAHQHIAYGGLLGQYYLEGLGPYLETFATMWSLVAIYLLLYASLWRGVAEGMALLAAWLAPAHAARMRRVAELACRAVYYAGVPLLVLLPFLQ